MEAFHFITRAAELKEDTVAQYQLGVLYSCGHGCERNEKQARRWLQRAARQGSTNVDINNAVVAGKLLVEFEAQQNLSSSGMKQEDRWNRFLQSGVDPKYREETKSVMDFVKKGKDNPPSFKPFKFKNMDKIPDLAERAEQGSKTAQIFFTAMTLWDQVSAHLQSIEFHDAFIAFRAAERAWDRFPVPEHQWTSLHRAAKMAFDANPNDAEALFVILRCQMRANIHPIDGLAMAKKCVSLNPMVADFHHLLGCLHGFVEDFISATRCFERALELDPIPDWLYDRASSLRLQSDRNPNTVIKAYEDYIAASEPDSRKVPEAYYCIGQEYQMMNNDKKVEEFLKKATEAENPPVRLSFFGPVNDEFPPKFMLQNSLKNLMKIFVEN